MKVLAGDIGGTKTLLALCDARGRPQVERRYESAQFPEFETIVRAFVDELGERPARACFGIAGPVADDRGKTTNLPWTIDGRRLEAEIGIEKVRLFNDFHTVALSIEYLEVNDTVQICRGERQADAPVAILGAGTGLGEAFLVPVAGRYEVLSSEGGHADFAPRTDVEIDLLRFLCQRHGRVSYERVLSGPGLVAIYEFLRERGVAPESPAVRRAFATGDPAAAISKGALSDGDPLAAAALDLFVGIYGAEAGNLALRILARGGVYLGGGIAPRILDALRSGTFERSFRDKGRLSTVVEPLPVYVIVNPQAGLIGAAAYAARM